ncbi:26S proteasome non-ATPase regulatory subunit 9-like isoform X2 [Convolutriloba macropyga]|uniref:26S proteasome non-ATPase regulatory subunit 9-like isoform X2 n=1 Tax=Convolutriloba macropyga TaxID=536237 RepID=UPI003F525AA8
MEVNEIDGVLSEASNTEGAASESNNTAHGALDETRAHRQPGVSVQLGDELRRSLMQLDEERRNIELEVAQLNEILNTDIGVGMHGPLIDSEDYPRSDIDVHLARISRHRVACLQTDHSHIMTQIQHKLHQLHSITRDRSALSGSEEEMLADGLNENSAENDPKPYIPPPPPEPFLRVEQVIEGSPAYKGGLRNHDLILRFGTVTKDNFNDNLAMISNMLSGYQGSVIGLEISREENEGRPLRLSLTPHVWSGRGLLGCRMVPLPKD